MKTVVLKDKFRLIGLDCCEQLSSRQLNSFSNLYDDLSGEVYDIPQMPMQVHDILIHHGIIDSPAVVGNARGCLWVAEKDWIYITKFSGAVQQECTSITFMGMDVLADVYLNGVIIGKGNDVFLPLTIDITGMLQTENTLIIHFHSPHHYLNSIEMPERYKNKIMPKYALIREYHRGYGDYLGFKPYLTRIGIYDEIIIQSFEIAAIQKIDISSSVSRDLAQAHLNATVFVKENWEQLQAECVLSFNGKNVAECNIPVVDAAAKIDFIINEPNLWWCIGYGNPNLYTLSVMLKNAKTVLDQIERRIGFRRIDKIGDFDFTINNLPLKIWGANLAPVDSITACYQKERTDHIVDMAIDANMNCLRVWGGGDRFDDDFYNRCDRLGLLLWQDFFHDYSMYPDDDDFRELCRKEVRYQVGRLKHHPSILMWCGSNESVMCRDFSNPGEDCIGFEIYNEDYRQICRETDPDRYYAMTSPDGGKYANDPLEGDTHSYTSTWFVPGGRHPVFLSENMRSFPPAYRSMERMMGTQKLWPIDYNGQTLKNMDFPWPETWRDYTSAEGWQKISEVEHFYDANDAQSMIYRFGASVAAYINNCVGRYRRGRPVYRKDENIRLTKGHLWWKMNTSALHIYSGLLDYYLEPSMPYYALKRAYEPFTLSFDIDDFITVWAINDTRHTIRGKIFVKLFNVKKNKSEQFFNMPFEVQPDHSACITDLNRFQQFTCNEHVIYAKAVDENGTVISEIIDYTDIERHIQFPDCKLIMTCKGDILTIQSDSFARCIEISGDENGDLFGWEFSDNYFDLIPGQIKHVKIKGKHLCGTVTAKGYYSSNAVTINYKN